MENKKERTVIHVEYKGEHYYFGSLSAIYTLLSSDELGITLGSLRNYGVKIDKPYKNSKCVIRKNVLITIPKKRK